MPLKPMWRFRGSMHYLGRATRRLGLDQTVADQARHNPEFYRLCQLVGTLSERYHRARREDGVPVFYPSELSQIKSIIEQCELELQKLHMLAAASDVILADVWPAFNFHEPERPFGVWAANTHILPLGDGTVGMPDEPESALTESG